MTGFSHLTDGKVDIVWKCAYAKSKVSSITTEIVLVITP